MKVWLSRLGLAGLGALAGCEIPRPNGAFVPIPPVDESTQDADPAEEIYGEGGPGDFGFGDGDGDGDASGDGDGDGDDDPAPADDGGNVEPEDPLTVLKRQLSGDYWMRVDTHATASSNTITARTHSTSFSLVQIGTDPADDEFKLRDWQCHVEIVQDCGTATCSTSLLNAKSGKAHLPATRTLVLDMDRKEWTASECAFALGWRWNFAEQGDRDLPLAGDDLIYDPDGSGDGINLRAKARIALVDQDCEMRVIQKIAWSFSDGTYDPDARTWKATVDDVDSQQRELYDPCSLGRDTEGSVDRAPQLTMVPAPSDFSIPSRGEWPCPSLAEFKSTVPEPR